MKDDPMFALFMSSVVCILLLFLVIFAYSKVQDSYGRPTTTIIERNF